MNFREMMDEARPDVVERQRANVEKGELAMRLRELRDARGMGQEDVARVSGLGMDEVELLEALTGDMPGQDLVDRYVSGASDREIRIHPETGVELVRGVRPFDVVFDGRTETVDLPGWYPSDDPASDNGIHTGSDCEISDQTLERLRRIAKGGPF